MNIVSCNDCIGACCRQGMAIPLKGPEASRLVEAGTDLRLMKKSEWQGNKPGLRRNFYELMSDCGNLATDAAGIVTCRDYENRPAACSEFKTGGFVCEAARTRAGVTDLPVPTVKVGPPQ